MDLSMEADTESEPTETQAWGDDDDKCVCLTELSHSALLARRLGRREDNPNPHWCLNIFLSLSLSLARAPRLALDPSLHSISLAV